MSFIDRFLNTITMYRLVLYELIFLAVISIIFSYIGKLGYNWPITSMIFSLVVLLVSCYIINLIFSKILRIPINIESSLITALILFLIMPPASTEKEIIILVLVGFIAMASKYLISPFKKHIFNPVALAIFIIYILNFNTAIWWVGDTSMIPFLLIFGFLVIRKIKRFAMFLSFTVAWLFSLSFFERTIFTSLQSFQFALGPTLFFATIMLTEPITTPPTRKLQIIYGALAGFLLNVNFRVGKLVTTPEFVLILVNIFSYSTSPKRKLIFLLKEKNKLAKDIYEFIFIPDAKFSFRPGQYLEWTLAHNKTDSRGNRRFFTIASSPTENYIKLGVKYNNPPSSFKNKLFGFKNGDKILAGQLGGDFVLPRDSNKKLVFLAGGIGITPFRSMIKYLLDKGETRDIVLLYNAKSDDEIVYHDLFAEAQHKIGFKPKYVIGNFITEKLIKNEVPDYIERNFYISGPAIMVNTLKKMLLEMGVSRFNIKTDYFPGFV